MKKNVFIVPIILSFFLISFTACNRTNTDDRGEKYGGTLRVNASDIPDIIFPGQVLKASEHLIISHVYTGLLKYNTRTLEPEPALAKKWTTANNGLSYRFEMNTQACFHDDACFPEGKGRKIVATDVKYSIEQICHLHLLSQHELSKQVKNIVGAEAISLDNFSKSVIPISGISVINDSVIEFHLVAADELFTRFLAGTNSLVFPKEAFEAYGFRNTVGSGSYKFKYNKIKGPAITLEANLNYFEKNKNNEKLPFIDTIVVSFFTSPPRELQLFETGMLHLVLNVNEEYISPFLEKNIEKFKSNPPTFIMKQTTDFNNRIKISFVRSNLQGLYLNPQGYLDFSSCYLEEPLANGTVTNP